MGDDDDGGLVLNLAFEPPPAARRPRPAPAIEAQPNSFRAPASGAGSGAPQQQRGAKRPPGSSAPAATFSFNFDQQQNGEQKQRPGYGAAPANGHAPAQRPATAPGRQADQGFKQGSRPQGDGARGGGYGKGGGSGQQRSKRPSKEDMKRPFDEDAHRLKGADSDEEDNIMAFVSMTKERDARLEAELAATGGAGRKRGYDDEEDEGPGPSKRGAVDRGDGVVEFGDAQDETDYRQRPDFKRQRADGAPRSRGKAASAGGVAGDDGKPAKPAVKPAAHKVGEFTHAETHVPDKLKLDYFEAGGEAKDWAGLGLAPGLAAHLGSLGFAEPTKVQQASIPALLQGRDALVKAPTGSGKTLAYLAPIVHDLQARQPRVSRADGTFAVVLAPTRELAIQISDVLGAILKRYVYLVSGMLIGGENRVHEKARLRKGVSILVASPGRLLDHLQNTTAFKTSELKWLVADEADRLLDLGFEQKIGEIVSLVDSRRSAPSAPRQTVLLSATLHSKLGALAQLSLRNPVSVGFKCELVDGRLQVADAGSKGAAAGAASGDAAGGGETYDMPKQLRQLFITAPAKLRLMALVALIRSRLKRNKHAKLVVFMSSCDGVEFHHSLFADFFELAAGAPLAEAGCPVLKLHGDMLQAERTSSFVKFTQASSGVLLCTDVAARGLDFPAVTTIVQYDPPGEPSEYVHRVGRTARMGQRGDAVLLLLPSEGEYVGRLMQHGVQIVEEKLDPVLQWLPPPGDGQVFKGKPNPQVQAALLHRRLSGAVTGDKVMKQLAEDAFRSFVRAYSTHPASVKSIFHVKKLHIGHVAHSFALADPPTMVGQSGSRDERKKRKADDAKSKIRANRKAMRRMPEIAS